MNTPISDLGEFGLIRKLTEQFAITSPSRVRMAVGDDAAILQMQPDEELLVTTDMLLEGVHFDMTYMPLKHLGYKAVVVNVSDICAMNGIPQQITVSLGISAKYTTEMLEELYKGIELACQHYQVDLVGGDTCASCNGLAISITCLGSVPKGEAVLRSGAQPNDLICVTGNLGAAYMGFQLLEREQRTFLSAPTEEFEPHFEGYEYLIERQLMPSAQRWLRDKLAEQGVTPTAMIDISDGLSSELLHIAERSQVGVRVYEDRLPLDRETLALCEEMNMSPITAAFNGGEDYELLFTVPLAQVGQVSAIEGVSIIGHATELSEGRRWVSTDRAEHELKAQGWNAFS